MIKGLFINIVKEQCIKERVHSERKTFERLDNCSHIQPITFFYPKSATTIPDIVSVSKIYTSMDLHHSIRGPASQHPMTCIRTSEDPHQDILGPASHYLDLHQAIRTCISLPEPFRPAKERGWKKINTIGIISKLNLIIDEIFISEWTFSLS